MEGFEVGGCRGGGWVEVAVSRIEHTNNWGPGLLGCVAAIFCAYIIIVTNFSLHGVTVNSST